jgi:hypothetical protein
MVTNCYYLFPYFQIRNNYTPWLSFSLAHMVLLHSVNNIMIIFYLIKTESLFLTFYDMDITSHIPMTSLK